MKIFQTERNSTCPCGSGRKFKKCCQGRVEEATRRIRQAVSSGGGGFTPEGLEVIETLGFLCGLQAEDGHMPAPETLGSVLNDAWEAEEQIRGSLDQGALSTLSLAFQVLLGEKQHLRTIRIPVWQFASGSADDEDEDLWDLIDQYLTGDEGLEFIEETVNSIGLSLLYDDYTDEELKTLLIALGWFVIDDTRDLFLYTVLHKTRSDLAAAEEKMDEIMKEQGNDDQGEMYQELRSVMRQYPAYDQMLSDNLRDDIGLVMSAVAEGELKIEVPLYSVLGGIYAVFSKLTEILKNLHSRPSLSPPLEETLFADGEYHYFFPQVIEALQRAMMETEDEQYRDALDGLLFFLVLLSDTRQIKVIKSLLHHLL
jgi:exonuclease VII small subunit